jgi:hypothetical protein
MTEYRHIINNMGRLVRVDEDGRPAGPAGAVASAIVEAQARRSNQEPAFGITITIPPAQAPSSFVPPESELRPVRNCLACGQEIMGKRIGTGICGDCFGSWDLKDKRPLLHQVRSALPLDARIRQAQPETEEHAWMTATSEGVGRD